MKLVTESLKGLLRQAVVSVREHYRDRVVVICHNDADGIAAGFILKAALTRAGFNTELFCLEKLYAEALEVLFQKQGVFILGDLGSAFTKLLSSKNIHQNHIIILDHHQVLSEKADEKILLPDKKWYSLLEIFQVVDTLTSVATQAHQPACFTLEASEPRF